MNQILMSKFDQWLVWLCGMLCRLWSDVGEREREVNGVYKGFMEAVQVNAKKRKIRMFMVMGRSDKGQHD